MADNGRRKRDDALAVALAAGQTLRDAAAAAGIGERTATRRWADPDFRRRVAELRADMVSRATGRMGDGMAEAADVLRALLKADSQSVRLGACRAMLELGVKLRDSVELEQRIAALEALEAGVALQRCSRRRLRCNPMGCLAR
jgi:hypothetical protein